MQIHLGSEVSTADRNQCFQESHNGPPTVDEHVQRIDTIGLTNGRAVYVFINCGRVVDGHCSPLLPALTRGAVHQTHHDSNSVESASGE